MWRILPYLSFLRQTSSCLLDPSSPLVDQQKQIWSSSASYSLICTEIAGALLALQFRYCRYTSTKSLTLEIQPSRRRSLIFFTTFYYIRAIFCAKTTQKAAQKPNFRLV